MQADADAVSEDAALGGKLVLRQPRRGHRFGHDSILLAAAVSARPGEQAVDLGSGVGTVGLALARRVEGVAVTLVEIDPALAALGRENAARNGLAGRVRAVCLDVMAPAPAFAAAGLGPGSADHVVMNPPFNAADNPSRDHGRRLARTASDETLPHWLNTAARLLRPSGVITLIWRADALGDVQTALAAGFGAISILPVHPKPEAPAIRVLVRAVKDHNKDHSGSTTVWPGFVLADASGRPSARAEAVLREGAALPLTGD